jgi:hypothetical protein
MAPGAALASGVIATGKTTARTNARRNVRIGTSPLETGMDKQSMGAYN